MARQTKEQRRKQRKAKEQRKRESRRQEIIRSAIMSDGLFQAFHAYWFIFRTMEERAPLLDVVSRKTGLSYDRAHGLFTGLFLGLLSCVDLEFLDEELLETVSKMMSSSVPSTNEPSEEETVDPFVQVELVEHFADVSRMISIAELLSLGMDGLEEVDSVEYKALKAAVSRFVAADFSDCEIVDPEDSARVFQYDPEEVFEPWIDQLLMRETSEPDEEECVRRTDSITQFLQKAIVRHLEAEDHPEDECDEFQRARVHGEIVSQILYLTASRHDTRSEEEDGRYEEWIEQHAGTAPDESVQAEIRAMIAPEAKALGALPQTDFYRLILVAARLAFGFFPGTARSVGAAGASFVRSVMDALDPTLMKTLEDEEENFFQRMIEESDNLDA